MVIFPSVPKWKQTLFRNGLVTEPSPFGNGDSFQYGDPHIEMGIHSIWFPIWKWGLTKRPHFHMGMCLSPFPYGNHHMEMGSHVIGLLIWKWGFPLSIWGCDYPHFHMVIAIWRIPLYMWLYELLREFAIEDFFPTSVLTQENRKN
jgi:hypothetical protein